MTKRQIEEAGLCYIKEKEEEHVKEQDNDENVVGMSPTAAAATREDGTQTMNEEEKANQDGNGSELHTATDIGAPTADISAAVGMEEEARGIEEEVGAPKEERTNAEGGRRAAQVEETAADTDAAVIEDGAAADTDAGVIERGAVADTDAQVQDAESLDPLARGAAAAAADAPVEDGGA